LVLLSSGVPVATRLTLVLVAFAVPRPKPTAEPQSPVAVSPVSVASLRLLKSRKCLVRLRLFTPLFFASSATSRRMDAARCFRLEERERRSLSNEEASATSNRSTTVMAKEPTLTKDVHDVIGLPTVGMSLTIVQSLQHRKDTDLAT
jgi:hypothetical protein